nr:MAG TPA: hypothetical protein [Bacteriophage sp.]
MRQTTDVYFEIKYGGRGRSPGRPVFFTLKMIQMYRITETRGVTNVATIL